jgi:excisionase family DNA binding protein
MTENVQTATSPLLHTIEGSARLLNTGRTTIYRAMSEGLIKFVKLGRATRIPQSEIERVAREGLGFTEADGPRND